MLPVRRVVSRWLLLCLLLSSALAPAALAEELPPPTSFMYLQTNGPTSPLGRGDWYTSTAAGAGAGYHYVTVTVPCSWPAGTPVYIDLFSPEMNTNRPVADEPDNDGLRSNTSFELYAPGTTYGPGTGAPGPGASGSLFAQTFAPSSAAEGWTRFYSIGAPVLCGSYLLRAESRADDQNSWVLRVGSDSDANPNNAPPANYDNPDGLVGSGDEIILGIIQATFQHDQTAAANQCLTLYEYVPPGLPSITFHNFDIDADGSDDRVRYYAPSASYDPTGTSGGVAGTRSANAVWNNGGTAGTRVGDTIASPQSGWWRIVTCLNDNNQFIQEGMAGLPTYYEQPPTPRVQIGKSDGRTTVSASDILTYTISITNVSNLDPAPGAAASVVITDTIPTNTSYLSCSFVAPTSGTCALDGANVVFRLNGDLDAGASARVRVTVQVSSVALTNVSNRAVASFRDQIGNSFAPIGPAIDTDTIAITGQAIGDRAWNDFNNNGLQDFGEPGLAGVVVQLWDEGPDNTIDADDLLLATTVSDASGSYRFSSLTTPAFTGGADYYLNFGLPAGWLRVTADAGADTVDSDPNANGNTAFTTISTNERDITWDAGYFLPGRLGDRLWLDLDRDGLQDIGEPGLPDVEVVLRNASGSAVQTVRTSANGNYYFTNITTPGTYGVDVTDATLPAGLATTAGSSEPYSGISVRSATNRDDIDIGYAGAAATGLVGDLVWSDADGDGLRDPGEPGLAGVGVALRSAGPDGIFRTGDDVTVATTTSGDSGFYLFSNVTPGEYSVDVTSPPTGYTLTTGPHSSSDPTAPFSVAAGEFYPNADFGYQNAALFSITDRVWHDTDNDAAFDAGEPGLAGVPINLLDASGNVIASTLSAAGGSFSFSGLPNGSYRVAVAQPPSGYSAVTASRADEGFVDRVISGASLSASSFAYRMPGAIGDTLFNDINNNGVQDPGENGIVGVTVALRRDSNNNGVLDASDQLLMTTVSDDTGLYSFSSLPTSRLNPAIASTSVVTYFVSIDNTQAALSGYTLSTPDNEGAAGHQREVGLTQALPSVLTADFGYRNTGLADISGQVWHDRDHDGFDDGSGEPGIGSVTVALIDAAGNLVRSVTSAADGSYSFADVPAGSYSVRVTDQGGALVGYSATRGYDQIPVTVAVATSVSGVDFGYARSATTGSIGDYIWLDADRDGVQDASEAGLPNATVRLWSVGPDGLGNSGGGDDLLLATTTSDANGLYRFDELPEGSYYVEVLSSSLPAGLSSTTGTPSFSRVLPISAGEVNLSADFGYASASGSAMGDLVWYDADGDGIADPGEAGIGGVQISVTGPSGTFNVTTDPDGSWLVPGLAPGNYTVTLNTASLPAGYNATPTNGAAVRSVTLEAGRDALFADFGFNGGTTGSIGDYVWLDADGDGVQDPGESGLPDVTLNLLGPGADNSFGTSDDVVLETTSSDTNGSYSFAGLPAGSYRVQVTDRAGILVGTNLSGGGNPSATIALAAGQTRSDIDFGYRPAGGTIGNRLWHDLDADGLLEAGEPGLEGVTINLYRDLDGDGLLDPGVDNLIRTVATDRNGFYELTGVPPGRYLVDVTDTRGVLAGFTKTSGTAGSDNNSQSDPYAINLTASNYTADFGYRATTPFTLSGITFKDMNNSAAYEALADQRFPELTMRLYRDLDGDGLLDPGEPLLGTTISAANGSYSFPDLPNGSYIITADSNTSRLSGSYQTTQTSTNAIQPATINNANSPNNNFGFFAPTAPTAITLISFKALSATPAGLPLWLAPLVLLAGVLLWRRRRAMR